MTRRAWVLNFDADDELAQLGPYTPRADVRARFRAQASRLTGLVAPDDAVVWEEEGVRLSERLRGDAFLRTPSALRRLASVGALVPPAPSVEVLRAVNHRRFSADLGQTLPAAAYVRTLGELEAALAALSGATWLLKRPFGYAGRGRRKVTSGALEASDRSFAESTFARWGGLQVEPWLELDGDFAIHGWLDGAGACTLGDPTVQRCDESGAWMATELARPGDLQAEEAAALTREATRAAEALHAAGYFGPFGVDAYRFHDHAGGERRFNPRSEVNARYSMGWGVGMGRWLSGPGQAR